MSRRGNCYDNAVMESFFSTVKSELADRFPSYGDAKMHRRRQPVEGELTATLLAMRHRAAKARTARIS
jgi:transposase InsO family protein